MHEEKGGALERVTRVWPIFFFSENFFYSL